MIKVILNYGFYDFGGIVKYRVFRLLGLMRLLEASNIPFKIRQIPHWNKLSVEIEEHSVYISRLTNMGLVGDDYNNITAFEIIKEAYESVIKYYQRKDENSLHYQKNTGEKCFSITFDSFYLESFSEFKRVEEIGPEHKNADEECEIADEECEIVDEECEMVDDEFEIADEEFEISRGEEESFSDVTTSDQNVIPSDEEVALEESEEMFKDTFQ
ncbi:uncharacterized protein isoform X2 [Rhodnius prolixus]|uniref:uncharacterized protein isoform X2 n=1 Tax=Rhodnius prolixus TaxID=13249 RepID=UPI003D18F2A1